MREGSWLVGGLVGGLERRLPDRVGWRLEVVGGGCLTGCGREATRSGTHLVDWIVVDAQDEAAVVLLAVEAFDGLRRGEGGGIKG